MGDSFATKDDVKQVERLLRADIGRAETSLQGKIDTVEVKLLDRIERVETTLLSEFHKYAHSSRARMLMTEVKTLTLSDRMAALETRVREL